ncbi:hypothetical protein [Mucilaginibacter myungsuensis]|uniref:Lipocalin-like protein n=1 Tax=Mucilaginibacter myungsuensis TaxID=649104 RepID=A0A929KYM8_9SPHI|nr:hypothetical protein [Mucilaginibacter myungsuensis]MBE9663582.1 hypothetical protein [Mucilaginibacter myungsuensis]MDN3599094.1 hypothetical protein [Mucilaginibacter myungsuensis]
MLKRTLFIIIIAVSMLTGCKPELSKKKLYGEWKYTKIDHPQSDNPADTLTSGQLAEDNPYITFKPQSQLTIHWGGKLLSHGTFEVKGKEISYTEQLPEGRSRTFPFFVSELDDKHIVFETLGADGSRVTAFKK